MLRRHGCVLITQRNTWDKSSDHNRSCTAAAAEFTDWERRNHKKKKQTERLVSNLVFGLFHNHKIKEVDEWKRSSTLKTNFLNFFQTLRKLFLWENVTFLSSFKYYVCKCKCKTFRWKERITKHPPIKAKLLKFCLIKTIIALTKLWKLCSKANFMDLH